MLSFAYPQLLYLLLAIPVIAALYFQSRLSRRRRLRRFGQLKVVKAMMPDSSRYMGWIKLTIECLALAFIIIAENGVERYRGDDMRRRVEFDAGVIDR